MSYYCDFCKKGVSGQPLTLLTTETHQVAQKDKNGAVLTREGVPVVTTEIKAQKKACPPCAEEHDNRISAMEVAAAKERLAKKFGNKR